MCLGLPVDVGQAQLLQLLIIIITKKIPLSLINSLHHGKH